MKRFAAIWNDTWWAWVILMGGGLTAGILVSPIFYSAIPISLFSIVYFAFMRYDDQGKPRSL